MTRLPPTPEPKATLPAQRTCKIPLCVDLDGTLVRSDLLLESAIQALRNRLFTLVLLPLWLLKGRAYLKSVLTRYSTFDPSSLPYDSRVIGIIRAAKDIGKPCVLVTASNRQYAEQIADHLGMFDAVVASDEATNLAGQTKAVELIRRFGSRRFDYVANHRVDLAVWAHAREAWVVNGSSRLAHRAGQLSTLAGHHPREKIKVSTWIRALRLHQWLKNLLLFVPLITAHAFTEISSVIAVSVAFIAFGICASSVYVINDLFDLPADRVHPRKRNRPFAAGALPISHGVLAAPVLLLSAFALASSVSANFTLVLGLYWVTTLAYSVRLKRVEILDVTTLGALYTMRIVAGGIAIGVALSFWLLAFSMFLFFSLAVLKRVIELSNVPTADDAAIPGRGYRPSDLSLLRSVGIASGFVSLLVFALYINSPESITLYSRPMLLWLLCPILLYWISRIWLLADRNEMHDDPVVFAATDRTSWAAGSIAALVLLVAI